MKESKTFVGESGGELGDDTNPLVEQPAENAALAAM
jgi:hypothetical protein